MDCYCDGEQATVQRIETRVARVAHKCYECCKKIGPGERYEYTASLYDGIWTIAKVCPRCLALREYVSAHVPCFCWLYGSMLDDAKGTIEDYAHEAPGLFMGYGRLRVAVDRGTPAQER